MNRTVLHEESCVVVVHFVLWGGGVSLEKWPQIQIRDFRSSYFSAEIEEATGPPPSGNITG